MKLHLNPITIPFIKTGVKRCTLSHKTMYQENWFTLNFLKQGNYGTLFNLAIPRRSIEHVIIESSATGKIYIVETRYKQHTSFMVVQCILFTWDGIYAYTRLHDALRNELYAIQNNNNKNLQYWETVKFDLVEQLINKQSILRDGLKSRIS